MSYSDSHLCTLFSFAHDPVGALDSDNNKIRSVRRNYRNVLFIEELCRQIADLPTMRGAVRTMPQLAAIPIDPVYKETSTLGWYTDDGIIRINMKLGETETRKKRFNSQLATLPHEMRHGFQDFSGCLDLVKDDHFKTKLGDQILHDRITEADATAFSLTVMYELELLRGNPEPMRRAGEIHTSSVEAYCKIASADEESHWNGKAAHAAFTAYFAVDNRDRLQTYDNRLCKSFMRSAHTEQTRPLKKEDYDPDLFYRYLKPIKSMAYETDRGRLVERTEYQPQTCDKVMNFVSNATRQHIMRAHRMYGLG